MSDATPVCPECSSDLTYALGGFQVCSLCAHEWSVEAVAEAAASEVVRDAVGNVLQDGDTVTVTKALKVKGSGTIKVGTKVRNIRLVDGDHDIDCKIDGIGAMGLKTQFVRRA